MSRRRRKARTKVQHKARAGYQKLQRDLAMGYVRICPECGKRCYRSRKAAKQAMRELQSGDQMSVYPCGEFWHFGHTPYGVLRGIRPRGA